jgi:hypothetical protein
MPYFISSSVFHRRHSERQHRASLRATAKYVIQSDSEVRHSERQRRVCTVATKPPNPLTHHRCSLKITPALRCAKCGRAGRIGKKNCHPGGNLWNDKRNANFPTRFLLKDKNPRTNMEHHSEPILSVTQSVSEESNLGRQ